MPAQPVVVRSVHRARTRASPELLRDLFHLADQDHRIQVTDQRRQDGAPLLVGRAQLVRRQLVEHLANLCNEFGVEPMPRTLRIADVSKRNLKRINNPDDVMSMPYALIARRGRYNIFNNTPS